MCKQRVIVIGSGMGGLSCGVILAKNGYEVMVLEQGSQPGGCLQLWAVLAMDRHWIVCYSI